MAFEVDVPSESLNYLNQAGARELQMLTTRYAMDLLAEAGRLEAAGSRGRDPELTSVHVIDANHHLRRGYAKKPRSPWQIGFQLGAIVLSLLTGLMADLDWLKDPTHLIAFIVILAMAIACSSVALLMEWS